MPVCCVDRAPLYSVPQRVDRSVCTHLNTCVGFKKVNCTDTAAAAGVAPSRPCSCSVTPGIKNL